jgi:GAF domain-containing protein
VSDKHPSEAEPNTSAARAAEFAGLVLDLLAQSHTAEEVLTGVSELAAELIDDVDMASVTMIRDGAPATVASSHEGAVAIDETQYTDGVGPCLHAVRTADLARVDDVETSATFEKWRVTARELGVTASASIPLPSTPHIAAALNLYSVRAGGGWDQDVLDSAEILANYAGDAITIAYHYLQPERGRTL